MIFSLNAVDAADYARMMKVKPALFDKVIENIKTLVEVRGDSIYPSIVTQFLIDRDNVTRMVEMYDLARSLGVDRIAINAVLEIPRERIDRELLLRPEDADLAEPFVEEVLRKDADGGPPADRLRRLGLEQDDDARSRTRRHPADEHVSGRAVVQRPQRRLLLRLVHRRRSPATATSAPAASS